MVFVPENLKKYTPEEILKAITYLKAIVVNLQKAQGILVSMAEFKKIKDQIGVLEKELASRQAVGPIYLIKKVGKFTLIERKK